MKHFMLPRNTILRENQDAMPSTSPNPNSTKQKWSTSPHPAANSNRKQKPSKENAPPPLPSDLNSNADFSSPSFAGKPSPLPGAKIRSPLPPRPPPGPSSNPLKRKLSVESVGAETGALVSSDSGVKVIVRMRPPNKDEEEGEMIVQKTSNDSLTIAGHTFTYDSIADTQATQLDIFQLVGAPLVENCLAGFNSSVFAYGQTGSGKTYTIWGPANALLKENLSSDQQGLTPRVFQRLFSRIDEEQSKHADRQLIYQCRCSFLEIYNEQITDLLDPSQKNLQIREDVKTGVYVENLTEEYVSTMKDITQLLVKGLSNRRTGATSINAESSRSHSVFTCVVESRSKSLTDGLSCLKTSRINLVDLAGSERQKLTGAAGERLKEAGNINRSLSQLGNLINILAEVSQTGKQRHIPYRDSKLTFLLQESLGGNAKMAMICAISPAQSCKSETFSTLRFAQRAKAIKNKATVNEEMQDDVNVLREVIRQLKDELLRMKANGNQADPNGTYSSGWNARRSLNLLKLSLNRPMSLPHIDDDSDEEMEIVDEAEHFFFQSGKNEQNNKENVSEDRNPGEPHINASGNARVVDQDSGDNDVNMDEEMFEQHEKQTIKETDIDWVKDKDNSAFIQKLESESSSLGSREECVSSDVDNAMDEELKAKSLNCLSNQLSDRRPAEALQNSSEYLKQGTTADNLSLVDPAGSPILKSPTPSVSPRACTSSRKSLRTSSMLSASQKDLVIGKLESEGSLASVVKPSNSICLKSSARSNNCLRPTNELAASLQRGLEIIENHRQSVSLRRSCFRFSCKAPDFRALIPVAKVDVGVQTLSQETECVEGAMAFLCSRCKTVDSSLLNQDADDIQSLQLVTFDDGPQSPAKLNKQVPKAVEKVLAGAIRREMALEEICAKQASEIMQLNRLIQQYKHERECNAIISQTREDKILRLESLMDGILHADEFMEDELLSLTHEHKLLKEKFENHPEVLRTKMELKTALDELERYRNFFELGEREVLLEEIQDLRRQLQFYVDTSPKSSRKHGGLLQLTYPSQPTMVPALHPIEEESTEETAEQRFEQERGQWIETESKWISLVEELRSELEASRKLAKRQKQELDEEKNCSEELKEAMQLAMEGHARMLEQYAELEEKHIQLLARHRKIQDGIDDVKRAAAKAGVRGAESKFINALAAEISALKVEREKERRFFRDENKGLQAQLRDTAEAVQAAGELLVRLKDAEEAIAVAEKRAMDLEQEADKAYQEIDKLKKKHEMEISSLNQLRSEARLPKQALQLTTSHETEVKYDAGERSFNDQSWREEFKPFYNTEGRELSELAEPSSWFSGYDRCNI